MKETSGDKEMADNETGFLAVFTGGNSCDLLEVAAEMRLIEVADRMGNLGKRLTGGHQVERPDETIQAEVVPRRDTDMLKKEPSQMPRRIAKRACKRRYSGVGGSLHKPPAGMVDQSASLQRSDPTEKPLDKELYLTIEVGDLSESLTQRLHFPYNKYPFECLVGKFM
jgi:hypothetical protein